jgi:hypothetical protein
VSKTPVVVTVGDALQSQCGVRNQLLPSSLPFCPARQGHFPGRWIQTLSTHLCPQPSVSDGTALPINVYHKDFGKPEYRVRSAIKPDTPLVLGSYLSGDVCAVRNIDNEDSGYTGQWIFAPYTCKYHIYSRPELHQCLHAQNITHIQFQGDSMSRDLFGTVTGYLGVPKISEDNLKKMTNELKIKNLTFAVGDVIVSEGSSPLLLPLILRLI